jgi:Zn-dependent peptidase ImmA (M78 family)/transcriptional regulator with XRE-family HTH domain
MSSNLGQSELFAGERLQLAREFRCLTQTELGDRVAASCSLLSLCETGKKRDPAADLIAACATVLGFEPTFFYGPLEDSFRENECNFRHRRTTPEKLKAQVRAHATLLGMVVARLRACFRFPKLNVPTIRASNLDEIELAAEQCRRHWDLGIEAPILQVGRVLERAGVILVRHLVKSTKVDAFSRHGQTSVIFLNQTIQSTSRWNFDIAHECGHLVMHPGISTGSIESEDEANRFASAFLMPRKAFSREFRTTSFSWPHIFGLKRRWNVSASAIVRRAYDLGLLDAVSYRQAFKYMSAKGWTKGEPYEPVFQQPELLEMAISGFGKTSGSTLDSLRRELNFTADTFADVTGFPVPVDRTKIKQILPISAVR